MQPYSWIFKKFTLPQNQERHIILWTASLIFWKGWFRFLWGNCPGTMSITSTQIAVQESFRNAWNSLGVAIVGDYIPAFYLDRSWLIIQHSILFIIIWLGKLPFCFLYWILAFLLPISNRLKKKRYTRKQYQQVFPWSKTWGIESRPNTILVYMEFLFNQ